MDVTTSRAIDDVFDQDFSDLDDHDLLNDNAPSKLQEQHDDKAVLSPRPPKRKAGDLDGDDKENLGLGLGLDEEVQIKKKRQPVAKLDEARLLSQPGIPKIRSLLRSEGAVSAKPMFKRLKIKGKGHEFADVARLLNYYQLWLDNLYPRAKFADALQLVEKAGHTKRMQMIRSEWINEGKPGYQNTYSFASEEKEQEPPREDLFAVPTQSPADKGPDQAADDGTSLFIPGRSGSSELLDNLDHIPDNDELDALMAMQDDLVRNISPRKAQNPKPSRQFEVESEGEDDLDALLAEQDSRRTTTSLPTAQTIENDDDLDALLAEQEIRQTTSLPNRKPFESEDDQTTSKEVHTFDETHGNEDQDSLAALRAKESEISAPRSTSYPQKDDESDGVVFGEADDLDDALADALVSESADQRSGEQEVSGDVLEADFTMSSQSVSEA